MSRVFQPDVNEAGYKSGCRNKSLTCRCNKYQHVNEAGFKSECESNSGKHFDDKKDIGR